ncbi:MAG TPA: VacJ family lipoprotein [Nitrospiraceae bacterium]|nr:VacJ family lipoprotein [Nitrospiraceae bacterium]
MHRWVSESVRWVVFAVLAVGVTGCTTVSAPIDEVHLSAPLPHVGAPALLPSEPAPHLNAGTGTTDNPIITVAASDPARSAAPRDQATEQLVAQEPSREKARGQDEPYDPFARQGQALSEEEEEYDPWESFNSAMFEFNYKLDKYALKPVAKGYNFVMPDIVQRGISNFFHNVRFVPRFFNNLFQGKVKGAGLEMGRFLINSTIGLAGFFDVAKNQMGLETPDEDAGQTMGVYGVKPGPYLVLPFLGPFTVRDGIGYLIDIGLDPINWLVFPIIEIDGVPSAVAHKNRTTSTFAQLGTRAGYIINERSLNLEAFEGVEEATLDLYSAVRNAYLQRRARAIQE